MRTNFTLPQAVERVFGKTLRENATPASDWYSLVPYTFNTGQGEFYFKLIELPAGYHTSEEICLNVEKKLGEILHKAEFFLLDRTLQSCIYLVKARTNILPIKSLIEIKRQACEKIEENLIYKFLQFVQTLEKYSSHNELGFNLSEIALTQNGQFVLANYELYFRHPQKPKRNLNADIRRVIESLLMLSEKEINLMELYSRVHEEYGETMLKLTENCMKREFDISEAMTIMSESKESEDDASSSKATITDSYISDLDRLEESLMDNSFSEGQSFTKIRKIRKNRNGRKLIGFSVIFFIIMIGVAGYFTFKYLRRIDIRCDYGEYADLNAHRCLPCVQNCVDCQAGGQNQCRSCIGDYFLVKNSEADQLGFCSESCEGTIIRKKTCINTVQQQNQ